MAIENKNINIQLPILGILGIVFVVLKLCGVIGWSWWWVTAPFWGGIALVLGFALIALVIGGAGLALLKLLGK